MRISYLDGPRLRRSLLAACEYTQLQRTELNRINVFPVPDGDTGTNLALTVRAIADHLRSDESREVSSVAREAAEGANPLDPTSTTISKFNPFPVAKDPENPTVNVPILMAISLDQQGAPIIGGPLVIAGHGLTGDRTTLLFLAEKWVAAGATVVSIDAPVHGIAAEEIDFANVTPEIKALIDRAGMVGRANGNMYARKVGAAVVAKRRGGAMQTFNALNSFFFIEQMIVPGSMYWNMGVWLEKGDVLKDEDGMATMKALGENMAWLMKKLAD